MCVDFLSPFQISYLIVRKIESIAHAEILIKKKEQEIFSGDCDSFNL